MLSLSTPLIPTLDVPNVRAWNESPLGAAISVSAPLVVSQAAAAELDMGVAATLVELASDASYDVAIDLLNAGAEALILPAGAQLLSMLGEDVVSTRVLVTVREGEALPSCAGAVVTCAARPASLAPYTEALQSASTGRPVLVLSLIHI